MANRVAERKLLRPGLRSRRTPSRLDRDMAKAIQRVLLYRVGSLGDTMVALPAFHLVARAFPGAERRLLTNYPGKRQSSSRCRNPREHRPRPGILSLCRRHSGCPRTPFTLEPADPLAARRRRLPRPASRNEVGKARRALLPSLRYRQTDRCPTHRRHAAQSYRSRLARSNPKQAVSSATSPRWVPRISTIPQAGTSTSPNASADEPARRSPRPPVCRSSPSASAPKSRLKTGASLTGRPSSPGSLPSTPVTHSRSSAPPKSAAASELASAHWQQLVRQPRPQSLRRTHAPRKRRRLRPRSHLCRPRQRPHAPRGRRPDSLRRHLRRAEPTPHLVPLRPSTPRALPPRRLRRMRARNLHRPEKKMPHLHLRR